MTTISTLIQTFLRGTKGTMSSELMTIGPVVACLSLGSFGTVGSLLSEKTSEVLASVTMVSDALDP